MSELDLLKILQKYGEETELGDFSPEELQQLLEELEYGDEPPILSKEAFKEKYFASLRFQFDTCVFFPDFIMRTFFRCKTE